MCKARRRVCSCSRTIRITQTFRTSIFWQTSLGRFAFQQRANPPCDRERHFPMGRILSFAPRLRHLRIRMYWYMKDTCCYRVDQGRCSVVAIQRRHIDGDGEIVRQGTVFAVADRVALPTGHTDGRILPPEYEQLCAWNGGACGLAAQAAPAKPLDNPRPFCFTSRNRMKTCQMADPVRYLRMTSSELCESFFDRFVGCAREKIRLAHVDLDRSVVGVASPLENALSLPNDPLLKAEYFLERRELGALNIGGSGSIRVNGKSYTMSNLDCLYVGHAAMPRLAEFESSDPTNPAIFYLLSYPAHKVYPVTLGTKRKMQILPNLGAARTPIIVRYASTSTFRGKSSKLSCSCHGRNSPTPWKRMEHYASAYPHAALGRFICISILRSKIGVFHFMGPPEETRHLVLANRQVIVSPGWSIHARRRQPGL